jgi:hypothetical protein
MVVTVGWRGPRRTFQQIRASHAGTRLAEQHRVRSTKSSPYFELCRFVWFRTIRDADWRTGVSQLVSTNGAVIESDDPPSVFDRIAVVIALSRTGCIVGHGRVVRAQPSIGPRSPANFSVTIDHYALEHREPVLNGSQPVLHGC